MSLSNLSSFFFYAQKESDNRKKGLKSQPRVMCTESIQREPHSLYKTIKEGAKNLTIPPSYNLAKLVNLLAIKESKFTSIIAPAYQIYLTVLYSCSLTNYMMLFQMIWSLHMWVSNRRHSWPADGRVQFMVPMGKKFVMVAVISTHLQSNIYTCMNVTDSL